MAKRTTTSSPKTRTTKKNDADLAKTAHGNGQSAATTVAPTEDDIRLRAYHRYLERGGGHGADFDDWVEAEKDLRSQRDN